MIGLSVSGIKHYENDFYKNRPFSFAALSVTGQKCDCWCKHCGGNLLKSMCDASTPEKFVDAVDKAADAGCKGVLISGGSDVAGAVPVLPFCPAIAHAKKRGLKVVVHTGLADEETLCALKAVNVDQVLLDIIGSEKTIRNVYGIKRVPEDFAETMLYCNKAGLEMAPHLVVGLDFGMIEGEYNAIDMARRAGAKNFVLVVLTPKRGTKMQDVQPPVFEEVVRVFRYAAGALKGARITLGCARPFSYAAELEKLAVELGFDAIAYPHEKTIQHIKNSGIEMFFFEECCSLVGSQSFML